MTPTKEQIEKAREALEKIDYHPYSPDDGHYDYGYDQEQSGEFLDKHIDTIRMLLTTPEPAMEDAATREDAVGKEEFIPFDSDLVRTSSTSEPAASEWEVAEALKRLSQGCYDLYENGVDCPESYDYRTIISHISRLEADRKLAVEAFDEIRKSGFVSYTGKRPCEIASETLSKLTDGGR